jgi:hypothetical protein
MGAIKLEQFGGMLPAWDPHLLPTGQAADAQNVYAYSGALTGWRVPKFLRNLDNPSAGSAYRIPTVTVGTAGNTLTFLANPIDGDTVEVGEVLYTFTSNVADLASTPYKVLIGATAGDSAANIIAAVTLDNGKDTNQGILYGNGTSLNQDISITKSTASATIASFVAADVGAGYNTISAQESSAGTRMVWATTPNFTGGVNAHFDPTITTPAIWMEFLDTETTVVKSPVVDDQFNRYYWASPSLPPKYNSYDRITQHLPEYLLGINPPGCAPIVTTSAGGNSATLGLQLNTGGSFTNLANQIVLVPVLPTQNMTIVDVTMTPTSTIPDPQPLAARFAGVVYGDDGTGKPGLLLGFGLVTTGATGGTPVVSTFTSPVGVTANTQYWIGMMMDTSVPWVLSDLDNNAGVVGMSNTFDNGPPGSFTVEFLIPDVQLFATLQTASVLETRGYVYTWVTAYGEESAPSPATLLNGWSNGNWLITMWAPVAEDMGEDRNITTARLYRTVPGTTGQTVFYWCCDFDLATNKVVAVSSAKGVLEGTIVEEGPGQVRDTQGDDVVALNNQLQSTNWFPPPVGLSGIISMPNGMIVGWRGNELWFCEPYNPHAWPPGNVLTTEFPIVGVGVVGNSAIVVTGAEPYVCTGVNPSVMSMVKTATPFPGLSRGSIISGSSTVFYQAQAGLIQVDPNSQIANNVTEGWITREKWMQLTPQKNVHAVPLAASYFAFGVAQNGDNSVAQQGFAVELSQGDTTSFTIWPQPGGHRIGFMPLTAPNGFDIDNIWNDPWSGVTLLMQDGAVYYYDFSDPSPVIQPYMWESKIYQQKNKENFSAMRFFFNIPPGTPAQNPTRQELATDDPAWNTLNPDQYGIVYVYGDGNLITTREIRTNAELLRIGSGQKYEEWQWKIQGRVNISNIQVATSVKELRNV